VDVVPISSDTAALMRGLMARRAVNGAVTATVWTTAILLSRGDGLSSMERLTTEPEHGAGSWRADLYLASAGGEVARREAVLARHWSARWRGQGAAIAGRLTVGPTRLHWRPTPGWERLGAREFLLFRDRIDTVEVGAGRSFVVRIRGTEGLDALLRVHGNPHELRGLLRRPVDYSGNDS
jgi:hypothetical protein